jgi:hypothetical protein
MNPNLIDINKISIVNINDNSFKVSYNNQKLMLSLSSINIPFGLDNEYNNLYLKMELNNQELLNIIKNIEHKFSEFLDTNIKSQLRNDNILNCKIPKLKSKIVCHIKDKEGSYYNIYNIPKNQIISCIIYVDSIWKYDNNYFYKWSYKNIIIN